MEELNTISNNQVIHVITDYMNQFKVREVDIDCTLNWSKIYYKGKFKITGVYAGIEDEVFKLPQQVINKNEDKLLRTKCTNFQARFGVVNHTIVITEIIYVD